MRKIQAEIWKDVPEYEGKYQVSSLGKVRSLQRIEYYYTVQTSKRVKRLRKSRIMRQQCVTGGYYCVPLRKDGTETFWRVSRLVLTAFVGPCSKGMEACHGDGNRANNILENLRWGTTQDNANDRKKHNTRASNMTEDDVRNIRLLYSTGDYTMQKLADRNGVTLVAIWNIIHRKSWKYVD